MDGWLNGIRHKKTQENGILLEWQPLKICCPLNITVSRSDQEYTQAHFLFTTRLSPSAPVTLATSDVIRPQPYWLSLGLSNCLKWWEGACWCRLFPLTYYPRSKLMSHLHMLIWHLDVGTKSNFYDTAGDDEAPAEYYLERMHSKGYLHCFRASYCRMFQKCKYKRH